MPAMGIHRFILTLFKQQVPTQVINLPRARHKFSTRSFAQKNDLGTPVAAVYFNAQRESAGRRH
ncbi:hypothetical protein O6H91_03G007500 [Diphasiastrum complanatum]|nr:hypothetical protein O6H91_03G007500 [Diphasiastrum complanatum]